MRKYGFEYFTVQLLASDVPNADLDSMEKIWIALMNSRAPHGYNMTEGGDGATNPTKETREKISAGVKQYWRDPKNKNAQSAALKIAHQDPKTFKNSRAAAKLHIAKLWKDPVYQKQQSARMTALWANPDWRAARLKLFATSEYRKKVSAGLAKTLADPKFKKRMESSYKDPSRRKKLSDATKRRSPELASKMSELSKRLWKDPEYRARRSRALSQSAKAHWKDPEYRKRTITKIKIALSTPEARNLKSQRAKECWQDPKRRPKPLKKK